MTAVLAPRAYFTCPAHEIEVGDRLLGGTVASIKGAASPRGAVIFTFTDGTTADYGYAGTVIVLSGSVTELAAA